MDNGKDDWAPYRCSQIPQNYYANSADRKLEFLFIDLMWGGWGSNPRPADYEKRGPTLRVRYLHRYHGAVPPMALTAQIAWVTQSMNRSTP